MVRLDLFTTHMFPQDAILEVEVRESVELLRNEDRTKVDRDLTAPKTVANYKIPLKNIRKLSDITNEAKFVYENIRIPSDTSWRHKGDGVTHVMYLRVKNYNNEWISEETIVQFHWE